MYFWLIDDQLTPRHSRKFPHNYYLWGVTSKMIFKRHQSVEIENNEAVEDWGVGYHSSSNSTLGNHLSLYENFVLIQIHVFSRK